MNSTITSKTYDSHILEQGLEFQINKYYEPKEISLVRRIRVVLEAIDPRRHENILDIGCGVGTFAYHCAKEGADSVGIDYSIESIKAAKRLSERFSVSSNSRFIVGNAIQIPFKENYFDKIAVIDFIEHITDEEKCLLLQEIKRVLKQGGMAVIFTPNGVREKIGEFYWKIRSKFTGEKAPTTDLHYGLISKKDFEALLKKQGFNYKLYYKDITRPYLAKIPFLRRFLALELLWKIWK